MMLCVGRQFPAFRCGAAEGRGRLTPHSLASMSSQVAGTNIVGELTLDGSKVTAKIFVPLPFKDAATEVKSVSLGWAEQ